MFDTVGVHDVAERQTPSRAHREGAEAPTRMKAMAFDHAGAPLQRVERAIGAPRRGQIAGTRCRLRHLPHRPARHRRRLPDPKPHVIPGHEIIGRVAAVGAGVDGFKVGDRVGIPWLGHTCGRCRYCRSGRENLCERPGLHRLHDRRRLRRVCRRQGRLRFQDTRALFRCGSRAADVRRAHRLSRLEAGARGAPPRHLRVRRRRAHRCAARRLSRPGGLRVHARGRLRRRRSSRASSARSGRAPPTRRRRNPRRRHHLCARRAAWCRWRWRRSTRAARSSSAAST